MPRPPRPAREISISVRRKALHDQANYDGGPPCSPVPAPSSRRPVRLMASAFVGVGAFLSLLAFGLRASWAVVVGGVACAAVWALSRMTDPRPRSTGRHRAGRHRRPPNDFEQLQAMLGSGAAVDRPEGGGLHRDRSMTVGRL